MEFLSSSRITLYNINAEFFSRFPCIHGPCPNQGVWPIGVPCLRECSLPLRKQRDIFLWSFKVYTLLGMELSLVINTLEENT